MASFHCSAKIGAKGSGGSHSDYITREGKYSKEKAGRYEDLEATESGNMPEWAVDNPAYFWRAADEYERANGSAYRELVVALPRELTPDQRRELVEDFVKQELGERHAYQWAIHTPKASLEGGEQPHAHIMYSERIRDEHERDPADYFKRANKKNPEKGGCVKASGGKKPAELKAELVATRERWANVQNAHLERHGHPDRVTHLSLKDQGIDRQPERHIGAKGVQRMAGADISALLERRAAEGQLERANKAVGLIDLSGDITKAKADRDQLRQDAYQQALAAARQKEAQEKAERRRQAEQEKADQVAKEKANQVEPIETVQARLHGVVARMRQLDIVLKRNPPVEPNQELVELQAIDRYVQDFRVREIKELGPIPEKAGFLGLKGKAYNRDRDDIERRAVKLEKEMKGNTKVAVEWRAKTWQRAEDAYGKEYDAWREERGAAVREGQSLRPQYEKDRATLDDHAAKLQAEKQKAQERAVLAERLDRRVNPEKWAEIDRQKEAAKNDRSHGMSR